MVRLEYAFDLAEALALFLYFEDRGRAEEAGLSPLEESLRRFLYDHLSIEEMESPRDLLRRLNIEREVRGGQG